MTDKAHSLRWQPPRVEVDGDLAWLLRGAFSSGAAGAPEDIALARAAGMARRFGLAARVVDRQGFETLRGALGAEEARRLALEQAAVEARGTQILDLARWVAALAGDVLPNGGRVVFLKFAGLCLSGAVQPSGRSASDLDLLVAEADAEPLRARLLGEGFVSSSIPAYEHQLPALAHPSRGMVEIHTNVPGVRLDGRRFARLEDLSAAGQFVALGGWPPRAAVPSPEFLAAHAIAHGIAQHGAGPASYPLFQMVADVQDLGLADGAASLWLGWLSRDVSAREARAVLDLAAELAAGEVPESGDARWLLDHLLAGVLDDGYRQALKAGWVDTLSERWWPFARWRALRRALFPSRAELAVLYGPPGGALGGVKQRAQRPFDALLRYGRAASARGAAARRH